MGLVSIHANHHLSAYSYVGRVTEDAQFQVIWRSDEPLFPKPWLGVESGDLSDNQIIKEIIASLPDIIHYNEMLEKEINQRSKTEKREKNRRHTLELLAEGASLPRVLETIAKALEAEGPGLRCCILLLNERGIVQVVAAPNLPEKYADMLSGRLADGSFFHPLHQGRMLVEDMSANGFWKELSELWQPLGLVTAWSELIQSADNSILGILLVHQNKAGHPGAEYLRLMVDSARLAAVAIQHGRAMEKLRQLSQAVEFNPASIAITDHQGNIEYVNAKFSEVTGLALLEILGKHVLAAGRGGEMIQGREFLACAILDRQEWRGEICTRKADGTLLWELALVSPVRNDESQITHFLVVTEDISRRKQAEMELSRSCESAREHARRKTEFLANMSHEIRTPLNGILGFAQLLASANLPSEKREYVEAIQVSADTLLTMVNNVLDLGRMESGQLKLARSEFSLLNTVEEAVNMFYGQASSNGVDLVMDVPSHLPVVFLGDSFRVRQILVNLLSNAVKHTHQGYIVVSVRCHSATPGLPGDISISVKDTGTGISNDKVPSLFQPFTQAQNYASAVRGEPGSGLGLTITQRLAEMMDGRIEFETQPGKGTVFHVFLKLPVAQSKTRHAWQIQPNPLQGKELVFGSDFPMTREVLGTMMGDWGMKVSMKSLNEAMTDLMGVVVPGSLVILDMPLTGLQAGDITAHLKGYFSHGGMPPVLLTSPNVEIDSNETRFIRLPKPVNFSALYNTLAQISGARPAPVESGYGTMKGSGPALGQTIRILVVEDDPINQRLAMITLKKMDYHADLASNGAEAFELFKLQPYDVVLMDIQMPKMNGYECTRKIRDWEAVHVKEGGQKSHIIAVTANAMFSDSEKCHAAGMDDFIIKPLKVGKLQETLKGLCLKREKGGTEPRKDSSISATLYERVQSNLVDLANQLGREEIVDIASSYLRDNKAKLDGIHSALRDQDFSRLARTAHSMKGSSSMFAAYEIEQSAAILENSAKKGDATELSSSLAKLEQECGRLEPLLLKAINALASGKI